jgi:hypothetical protein
MGLGRPAPKSKADVVDALKPLGAKKSHTLKKLKEIAMSGGYSFNDFIGDVAHVAKEVGPDAIRMAMGGAMIPIQGAPPLGRNYHAFGAGRKKKASKQGGINLKDVLDSAVPSIANLVKSADPALTDGARKLVSKVKSAVGAGRGRSARTAIVKKVMKDRGVSMIEASKIVKAEGLY